MDDTEDTDPGFEPPARSVWVDLGSCSRCGGSHPRTRATKLLRAQGPFSHWAWCPLTHEPLMVIPPEGAEAVE